MSLEVSKPVTEKFRSLSTSVLMNGSPSEEDTQPKTRRLSSDVIKVTDKNKIPEPMLVFVCKQEEEQYTLQFYSLARQAWFQVRRYAKNKINQGAAVCGYKNFVFFISGWNSRKTETFQTSNTVFSYDVQRNLWKKCSNLHVARFGASAAELDDNLYVVGGRGLDHKPLLKVERYDPETDFWILVAPLNRGGGIWPAVAGVKGKLYVGGWKRMMETYDPLTDQWTVLSTTPDGLRHENMIRGASFDQKLYMMPYWRPFKLFVYDPEAKRWSEEEVRNDPSLDAPILHMNGMQGDSKNPNVVVVDRNGNISLIVDDQWNTWQEKTFELHVQSPVYVTSVNAVLKQL